MVRFLVETEQSYVESLKIILKVRTPVLVTCPIYCSCGLKLIFCIMEQDLSRLNEALV